MTRERSALTQPLADPGGNPHAASSNGRGAGFLPWYSPSSKLVDLLIVVALFALALLLRVYHLQTFPPGLYTDEAAYGLDALGVLNGDLQVFFPRNNGREPLFMYLLAGTFSMFGATPYTLRFTAALCGAATVVTTYWMVRQQFAFASVSSTHGARWYATWTALFLTFSYWHISFSRVGFRAITLPLMTTIAFGLMWFTWRRIRVQRTVPWFASIGTGIALGLCIYTYTAGRIVFPLFVAIAVAALISAPRMGLERRVLGRSIAVSSAGALLVLLPLALYFAMQPSTFGEHAAFVSVFNPQFAGERGPLVAALDSTRKMLLMFATLPDPNPRHNPGQIPVFDPLLAVWLVLGLGVAVARRRHLPSLFAFFWFWAFLLPAALTAEGIPHSLRAIGMLPIVYVLPVTAMEWVSKFTTRRSALLLLRWLPLPFLIVAAVTAIDAYGSAARRPEGFAGPFFVGFWELAESLRDEPDDAAAWILPLPPGEDLADDRLYTAEFALHDPDTLAPDVLTVVRLNEATLAEELARITAGKRVVNVLDTYADPELRTYDTRFMDPKGLLDLLLRRNIDGPVTEDTRTGIPYRSYPIGDTPDFTLGGAEIPIDVSFGNSVRLEHIRLGMLPAPGGTASGVAPAHEESPATVRIGNDQSIWVAAQWQAAADAHPNAKASFVLRSDSGEFAGQTDIFLTSDRAPRHPDWLPGEEAHSYVTVAPIAATPPGTYTLWLQVYHQETGEIFSADSAEAVGDAVPLAAVEVMPPTMPGATVEPGIALQDAELAPGFAVIGAEVDRPAYLSGDTISVILYFHAVEEVEDDLAVRVALQDADDQVMVETQKFPGGDAFPTSAWRKGEILRDWFHLPLDVTSPSGVYTLTVAVDEVRGAAPSVSAPVPVTRLEVINRPRILAPPSVTYPLTATFADAVRLVGVTTEGAPALSAGSVYTGTIIWQPLRRPSDSLVRFVQLLDKDGALLAQQDTTPCAGACPSTSWLPNEYLADEFRIDLPASLPPGPYQLITGWYERSSLERLRAFTEDGDEVSNGVVVLPLPVAPTD